MDTYQPSYHQDILTTNHTDWGRVQPHTQIPCLHLQEWNGMFVFTCTWFLYFIQMEQNQAELNEQELQYDPITSFICVIESKSWCLYLGLESQGSLFYHLLYNYICTFE